jgi:hypothetical protein
MKKTKLLFFSIMAFGAALLISSCGKDEEKETFVESDYVGVYYGSHTVVGIPSSLVEPIGDTITIADPKAGDDSVSVTSKALSKTFICSINNSGDITVPTFSATELVLSNSTNTRAENVEAKGSGSLSGKTAGSTAKLNLTITRGKLFTDDPDLGSINNLNLSGIKISGSFIKQ